VEAQVVLHTSIPHANGAQLVIAAPQLPRPSQRETFVWVLPVQL